MKKTMLTYKTLDRFEAEYIIGNYTEKEIEKIEFAAYVANMNVCNNLEWTEADIFSDFLRVLDIDKITVVKKKNDIMNDYMALVTSTETRGSRTLYHIGNRFTVETVKVDADLKSKNSLMNLWKKAGMIKKTLPSYICISTFYTDECGRCWGRYNVTEKRSDDGRRMVINFDYLREATPENERELVAECIRLMVEATGYQPEAVAM